MFESPAEIRAFMKRNAKKAGPTTFTMASSLLWDSNFTKGSLQFAPLFPKGMDLSGVSIIKVPSTNYKRWNFYTSNKEDALKLQQHHHSHLQHIADESGIAVGITNDLFLKGIPIEFGEFPGHVTKYDVKKFLFGVVGLPVEGLITSQMVVSKTMGSFKIYLVYDYGFFPSLLVNFYQQEMFDIPFSNDLDIRWKIYDRLVDHASLCQTCYKQVGCEKEKCLLTSKPAIPLPVEEEVYRLVADPIVVDSERLYVMAKPSSSIPQDINKQSSRPSPPSQEVLEEAAKKIPTPEVVIRGAPRGTSEGSLKGLFGGQLNTQCTSIRKIKRNNGDEIFIARIPQAAALRIVKLPADKCPSLIGKKLAFELAHSNIQKDKPTQNKTPHRPQAEGNPKRINPSPTTSHKKISGDVLPDSLKKKSSSSSPQAKAGGKDMDEDVGGGLEESDHEDVSPELYEAMGEANAEAIKRALKKGERDNSPSPSSSPSSSSPSPIVIDDDEDDGEALSQEKEGGTKEKDKGKEKESLLPTKTPTPTQNKKSNKTPKKQNTQTKGKTQTNQFTTQQNPNSSPSRKRARDSSSQPTATTTNSNTTSEKQNTTNTNDKQNTPTTNTPQ